MAPSSMAQGSMFEALFNRGLHPEGAFADALREVGYDVLHPRPEYPTPVWVKALEVARRHAFPQDSVAAAYRKLGRQFTDGFLSTLAGKVVAVALPFMNAESFLKRMPRYMQLGRSDVSMEVELQPGGRAARARLVDPFGVPAEFMAGVLEVGLEKVRSPGRVEATTLDATRYELALTW